PEGMDDADAEMFEHGGPEPAPMSRDELMPRGQHFTTQGTLDRAIEDGVAHLAKKIGEDRLFIGPAFHQLSSKTTWPDLVPITDVQSACQAIERIVEQGEGARGDWKTAHYGRFLGVLEEYRAARAE